MTSSSKVVATIGFIPIIVIASIFGAYLWLGPLSTSTSKVTPPSALSNVSTNQILGVRLALSINTSTVVLNESTGNESAILVNISDFNIRSTQNNISATGSWPIRNLTAGTCAFNYPFGIAIFKGNYDSRNISLAKSSIPLFPIIPCPFGGAPAAYYIFEPNSSLAGILSQPVITSSSSNTATVTTQYSYAPKLMSESIPITGYCCKQVTLPNCDCYTIGYNPFTIGTYTVVGGDEWGNLVVLHFAVTASQSTTSSSSPSIGADKIAIQWLSVRASSSNKFAPTIWSSLLVGSAMSQLTASIDGSQIYSQQLNQENVSNFPYEVSIQINKSSNLSIVVGHSYVVTYTATFRDKIVDTISSMVMALPPSPSNITVSGWELCAKNCVYPSPYLAAMIYVNASVPLSQLQISFNGSLEITDSSWSSSNTLAQYVELYKASPSNTTVPILTGHSYNVTFAATFEDGTSSTSSVVMTAS
ncbi:MAG: hypothetical protein JRN52_13745 [Nitrososphaerota archaeon]|nr:hypothetical protein [Nitrososphaerota archaeon]